MQLREPEIWLLRQSASNERLVYGIMAAVVLLSLSTAVFLRVARYPLIFLSPEVVQSGVACEIFVPAQLVPGAIRSRIGALYTWMR